MDYLEKNASKRFPCKSVSFRIKKRILELGSVSDDFDKDIKANFQCRNETPGLVSSLLGRTHQLEILTQ